MPVFQKLNPREITELTRRRSSLEDLEEYLAYLRTLKPGDWGSIELADDDSQRTVKRRTSIAATSQEKTIRWRTSRDGASKQLFFQVRDRKSR